MTAIEIRDYAPEDKAALIGLVRELQVAEGEVYDRMKPPEAIGAWYLDGLLEACRRQAGQILVAEQAGRVLGYAVIDVHNVRTLPEAFMVVLSPEGEVRSLRLLAFQFHHTV